ncbi:575_t:CDS:10 [Acaulospora morrowiae]|uniref:DNA 3'-5' helicase n=1 Tax=Acaulospora morrowiae TaxID=94023 RepID=A0A9N8YSZ0_9GLOM|nr:575_t:CDS:10 [Acaulospora morrowiae]
MTSTRMLRQFIVKINQIPHGVSYAKKFITLFLQFDVVMPQKWNQKRPGRPRKNTSASRNFNDALQHGSPKKLNQNNEFNASEQYPYYATQDNYNYFARQDREHNFYPHQQIQYSYSPRKNVEQSFSPHNMLVQRSDEFTGDASPEKNFPSQAYPNFDPVFSPQNTRLPEESAFGSRYPASWQPYQAGASSDTRIGIYNNVPYANECLNTQSNAYDELYRVRSRRADPLEGLRRALYTNEDLVVIGKFGFLKVSFIERKLDEACFVAPTGSGKTVVFELAMVNVIKSEREERVKMVYMAPTKAICSERAKDWSQRFRPIGITCGELTGDTDSTHIADIKKSHIIITTPEKWESVTRQWYGIVVDSLLSIASTDVRNLLNMLKLFMIDEVHMLREDRGATLEAVVSRMKLMGTNCRFVAISATVFNIDDVALWISLDFQDSSANSGLKKARVLQFGEEYRPVRLSHQLIVVVKEYVHNCQRNYIYRLLDVIQRYSSGKSTMVFCTTRKSTEEACQAIIKKIKQMQQSRQGLPWHTRPVDMTFHDKQLPELVRYGIAFHHAGLDMQDRKGVENLFLSGVVHVICATSTLAVGVNLPAHLVIIKSTMAYKNGEFVEYLDSEIKQMLGRAGRPQFDESGTGIKARVLVAKIKIGVDIEMSFTLAVIMTSNDMKQRYEELVTGTKDKLESSLHETLHEHLNSEICLGTINHVNKAKEWLRSTFLYVRMKSNPQRYDPEFREGQDWEKRLEEICMNDIRNLVVSEMVTINDDVLRSTKIGDAMAKYHLKYFTVGNMLTIFQWHQSKPSATRDEVIKVMLQKMSKAEEFNEVKLHRHEKLALNKLNHHADIRFKLSGKVKDTEGKIFIMIQCVLGNVSFEDAQNRFQANMESRVILRHGHPFQFFLGLGFIELAAYKENVKLLRIAMDLARCIKVKMWDDSPLLLKQLDGIGEQYARKLADIGITTIDQLKECETWKIETMRETVASLPKTELDINRELTKSEEYDLYSTTISLINSTKVNTRRYGNNLNIAFIAAADNLLLDFRQIPLWKVQQGLRFEFRVFKKNCMNRHVVCSVLPEEFIGLDVHRTILPDAQSMNACNISSTPPKLLQESREVIEILSDDEISEQTRENDVTEGEEVTVPSPTPIDAEKFFEEKDQSANDQEDYELLPNGRVKCHHHCKDKKKCAHECCKIGCRRAPKKRKISVLSPKPSHDLLDEPLIKTKRIRTVICSEPNKLSPIEVDGLSDSLSDDDKLIDPQELELRLLSTAIKGTSDKNTECLVMNDSSKAVEGMEDVIELLSPLYEENVWCDFWNVDGLETPEGQTANTVEKIVHNQKPQQPRREGIIPYMVGESIPVESEKEVDDESDKIIKVPEMDQDATRGFDKSIEESAGNSPSRNIRPDGQWLVTEDETHFKTFTEALIIFDNVLQTIIMQ